MFLDPAERAALAAAHPSLRRSIEVYYGDAKRAAAAGRLYSRFLRGGTLAFDIGSHVGDRIACFRGLGARVVAVEPQPHCAGLLRTLYGGDEAVTLIEAACGGAPGRATLHVNTANPTVTTASPEFITAAAGAAGWEGQTWDATLDVPQTTLDALIAVHGEPSFVKIDVEGFEHEVLRGLTRSLAALSFELTTIQRDVAYACLDALGDYRFDLALGESQELTFGSGQEIDGPAMMRYIRALPHEANSGDVYAIRAAKKI